jgi:hypothetical protein
MPSDTVPALPTPLPTDLRSLEERWNNLRGFRSEVMPMAQAQCEIPKILPTLLPTPFQRLATHSPHTPLCWKRANTRVLGNPVGPFQHTIAACQIKITPGRKNEREEKRPGG